MREKKPAPTQSSQQQESEVSGADFEDDFMEKDGLTKRGTSILDKMNNASTSIAPKANLNQSSVIKEFK